jgi:hypothetical protein
MNIEKNGQIFNAGFALGIAIVISSMIGAWALVRVKNHDQTITVTGSARKRIKSDLVIWRTSVTDQSPQLSDAYKALSGSVPRVKAYLESKGIPDNEITISSITTTTLKSRTTDGEDSGRVVGYQLSQELEVRSTDVDKITKISRDVTELINQGILLESKPPEYHYTKLGDLKIEMLADAAKDAKNRAQQVAQSTGSSVGSIRSAKMGVLQITPADSNEVSGEGMNDTTSLEKDITAVVNIGFAVN